MTLPDRVAFEVFGKPVYWYGVIMAFSILAGYVLAASREKRLGLPKDTTVNLTLFMLPAALICARLYYVVFSWSQYADNPLSVFNVRQGGLAIYGSILGGALVAFLYARKKKTAFLRLADLVAPSLALGQAIGRWGNFFNQEAYGVAVTNPALQFFPAAVWIESEGGWFAATFFYESAWCFLVCIALLVLERKWTNRKTGDIFLCYVALYALERSIVEGLRLDSLYWGSVRVSQLVSLLALAVCAVILIVRKRRK